jgi:hypothetical protein
MQKLGGGLYPSEAISSDCPSMHPAPGLSRLRHVLKSILIDPHSTASGAVSTADVMYTI